MITGSHVVLFSSDADADRTFLRDALEFSFVDAGHGWLIFKLPPAEIAVHPTGGDSTPSNATDAMLKAEFYLMCDDLRATIKALAAKNVTCTAISQERWGMKTTIRLPSGGTIGLYQPTHPTALQL